MTDKDPKDMTASEQLRWAANGEPYNGIDENIWTCPTGKIKALAEAVTGGWPSDNEIFSIVADKIDAELAQARELSLLRGAELWAKANGWPDFRDGEDFGAWLERCAIPRPRFEDGEPVQWEDDLLWSDKISYIFNAVNEIGVPLAIGSDDMICAHAEMTDDGLVKRPAPEVLGADGLPIKVGDTVYELGRDEVLKVYEVNSQYVHTKTSSGGLWNNLTASYLTHTPPDTQQKIDDDATMHPAAYCAAYGIDLGDDPDREKSTTSMIADLLRRQREYDKRKGGAE